MVMQYWHVAVSRQTDQRTMTLSLLTCSCLSPDDQMIEAIDIVITGVLFILSARPIRGY